MMSRLGKAWDPLVAIAVLIILVMMILYVEIIRQQGNQVAFWFLGGLAGAALLDIYATFRAAPRRGLALAVAGVALSALGIAGILSIGLPIIGAGALTLVCAARSQGAPSGRTSLPPDPGR
jgi:hypothetical protein